jgi:hypothetical protein
MADSKQQFSSDDDILPEGEPISPWKVGCLGLLAYKLGCLLAIVTFIVVIGLLVRFGVIR